MPRKPCADVVPVNWDLDYSQYRRLRSWYMRTLHDHRMKLMSLHDGTHTYLSVSGVKQLEQSRDTVIAEIADLDNRWESQQKWNALYGYKDKSCSKETDPGTTEV